MEKTTLLIIPAKNEFELVKKFNEDKREFFATQPYQKNDGTWIMFCYSHKQENVNNVLRRNAIPSSFTSNSPAATKKQIDTLYSLNADFNAETITKKEAYLLLKELLSKKK